MTWEQYWFGDPWMAEAYREAYLLKRRIHNEDMWIQGFYFFDALGAVISTAFCGKKQNYFDKPQEFFPKTAFEQKQEEREERRKLIQYLTGLKKRFGKAKEPEQKPRPQGEPTHSEGSENLSS